LQCTTYYSRVAPSRDYTWKLSRTYC